MSELTIPVFPLHTVLFPGGVLPLRIFEPRYLDMISKCMKTHSGFGVCLIREGHETGVAADVYAVGTLANITDWHRREDGLLGITVVGQQRFTLISHQVESNQLITARVALLPAEADIDIPAPYLSVVELLRQTLAQIEHAYPDAPQKYTNASWVSYRLSELLPLTVQTKQEFLQLHDPLQRLERIQALLAKLDLRQGD